MTNTQLTTQQVRVLIALSKAKGAMNRNTLADKCFNGNSVNFVPILSPLIDADLVKEKQVDHYGDGSRIEDAFIVTDEGRTMAGELERMPPPTVVVRTPGQVDHRDLEIGRVIRKTWGGREHYVTVVVNGFEYEGRVYTSLSATAKAVRRKDSEVNGWEFFGLG